MKTMYSRNSTYLCFKLTYHRLLETMKHGYAIRSGLADPYFYGQEMLDLEERCSNPDEIEEWFLKKIDSDIMSELRTE